ncbi:NADH-quinone oxidoreductase subunit L [Candidatus Fokinia solitaria]|uniref:NADH-quinone oxidoreductase subunit L n=1 Tax=Candidatus Fokinia solitaria TaxID=1802984 RepID=A0A2U8BRE7_9RICK|nr:NADH-quinone oxidoreductase subunit L [Candidatus Fokinia solitaria]AWD32915.1 NADH-quinone oxidoreductase subunit L [Candidatus Fokinia solitaria]
MLIYLASLTLTAPLLSGIIQYFFCSTTRKHCELISMTGILLSLFCAALLFYEIFLSSAEIQHSFYSWLKVEDIKFDFSITIDTTIAAILLVVCIVSAAVHLYSIEYMSNEPSIKRYMLYLALFTFFMVFLLISGNLLQMFIGWEGVGCCSYFLICFWFEKSSATKAALKAFLTNRIADIFLLAGIIQLVLKCGSADFHNIALYISSLQEHDATIDIIACCILLGAMGKSAQILFHVWLPDAMEGPTPVSALIHAATMVAAGIFIIVKCQTIFEYSTIASNITLSVGAITAFLMGIMAIFQTDIKKIIAYSTCSQLGYMFMSCGIRLYSTGVFHLITHAFFKALLFLCAGSIIHTLHGEQNIFKMKLSIRSTPLTYCAMIIGIFSITGVFPFGGFFSKEMIISGIYQSAADSVLCYIAYIVSLISAFFTAIYSFRMLLIIFHSNGTQKYLSDTETWKMKAPLILLSLLSAIIGYVGYHTSIFRISTNVQTLSSQIEHIPIACTLLGGIVAYLMTRKYTTLRFIPNTVQNIAYLAVNKKFYFEEFYAKCAGSLYQIADIAIFIEHSVLDGGVSKIIEAYTFISQVLQKIYRGRIEFTLRAICITVLTIAILLMYFKL